ncbi:MBL fold metallo-hydrolase [Mycolicibacterium flavescens]|uniref:MBL fold metallo-hydrolase n=1 Tax=Mycolicibacterium flavescens TaxID=1776 RepID=A0A1E3REV0_MYCFV|nr:MBL fold metallo-hydrolase [Mycolicibacterium flavescens]MCV7280909.1 MBL fold metallo-hydrolase [Mycolicibacterium flavescens]ODQ88398.1 MBL fold metallo-hydrolase [Mycolicibacterium flavescens]
MDVTVTFIGTATTLISGGRGGGDERSREEQITLLTDPNFLHEGQHAYLGYGLLSKRLKGPALDIDQLPAIDAVVLSHMHGDHWDRVSQSRLDHALPVVTTPHAAKRLIRRGFDRALALQTWQHHTITKGEVTVTVTALPGRHAPTPVDRFLPPVMGSLIEFSDGTNRCRLYVSGDTLMVDELREIPVRFDSIDVGVLHLGGTRLPFGRHLPFGLTVTMDGRQGADVVELLDLPRMIPVHFDDYGVFASPLSDFVEEMKRRGLADRIIELERGSSVVV